MIVDLRMQSGACMGGPMLVRGGSTGLYEGGIDMLP